MAKAKLGSDVFEITDTNKNPIWVDVLTDARNDRGVIRLSMGAFVGEGDERIRIQIVERLRMNHSTASALKGILETLLHDAPSDKQKAN